jgi:hypothetical protein
MASAISFARTSSEHSSLTTLLPSPQQPLSSWAFYASDEHDADKLQKAITAVHESTAALDLLTQGTASDRARLLSCQGKFSGAWLTALPMDSSTRISSFDYRLAMRLRLGLPPSDAMPARCACGDLLKNDQIHFLSCNLLRRTCINFQHNRIVQTIHAWILRAGGTSLVEPTHLSLRDNSRPDLRVTLGDRNFLVDAVCCHPTAPTHVSAGQAPLGTALQAVTGKNARYTDMACEQGATFIPFAVETYGAFAPDACNFIRDIADHAENS